MVQVTFFCHGESIVDYRPWLIPVDSDCGLTREGLNQALSLHKLNPDVPIFHLLLFSPMKRSLDTLIQSELKGLNVYLSKWIRPQKINICDFKENEIQKKETEEEFQRRIKIFRNKLYKTKMRTPRLQTVAVITHKDFIENFAKTYSENKKLTISPGQHWIWNYELEDHHINKEQSNK